MLREIYFYANSFNFSDFGLSVLKVKWQVDFVLLTSERLQCRCVQQWYLPEGGIARQEK